MDTLVPLTFPAGVYKNGTPYQGKNRWTNSHLARWHEGALRPVGGWSLSLLTSGAPVQVTGKPRAALSWRKNDASAWIAVGTPSKLYALSNGVLTDITPAGLTTGVTDGTLPSFVGAYGDGGYGDGPYGALLGGAAYGDADTWSLDNFGEILIATLTSDGKLYGSTPTAQATQLAGSPTGNRGVVVTPERFIFALGGGSDPRLVQWPSQQSTTDWTPTFSNTAGSFPIQTNGRLIAGRRTARETLLWTDADLWAAVYVGGTLIYSFQKRGDNCGLVGANAIALAEGAAYWMGTGEFWRYDGQVRSIPCDVSDYVFGDLNSQQRSKITAVPVPQFGEVWWFYPSASQSGLENDRYVAVNYREGYWMLGTLARAAGVGAGVFANPLYWTPGGNLYLHESGSDRGGDIPFVESGPLEIGNGDQIVHVQRLVSDEKTSGDVEATFYASFAPNLPETAFGPYPLTPQTDVRVAGRQVRVRLSEHLVDGLTADTTLVSADDSADTSDSGQDQGQDWRIGSMRLGLVPGGRR